MKNVYTIVKQKDENIVFETFTNLKKAKKAFKDFYYWYPNELSGVMLYKNGSLYSEEYMLTNPFSK